MEEEGAVSLWVGQADTAEALEEYMMADYSEDGDWIPSPFAKDFGITYYDEDFGESQFHEKPSRSVRALLAGHSNDKALIRKFTQLIGDSLPEPANVVIALYNFQYDGDVKAGAGSDVKVRYVGSVTLE